MDLIAAVEIAGEWSSAGPPRLAAGGLMDLIALSRLRVSGRHPARLVSQQEASWI